MQIDRILFPVTTLGPGNRLGIWTIGCPHRCFNCSNPELWNDDAEKDISLSELVSVFKDKKSTTDGVTITGGEPFYQVEELFLLLGILRQLEYSDILVYTGYKYEFIKETFAHVLEQIDVLVDGLYDDSLNNDVGQKGSANQRCIIQIGASGEMTLRVADSRKLLVKVVGTETNLTQAGLVQKFRAFLMTKFKTYLAGYIRNNAINIFQIDEKLTELSGSLEQMLVPDFLEYGVSLIHFFITTIVKPEDDSTYKRFKEIHFRQYADIAEAKIQQNVSIIEQETEKQKMILEAEGLAQKRQIEGYTYAQERGFDVAQTVAGNEGSGNMANLGVGLGIMAGVGNTVGGLVNDSIGNAVNPTGQQNTQIQCPKCGNPVPANAKFCLECGSKIESIGADEMLCPKCGKKTPKGKFCMECGARLQNTCPNCGKEVPQGAKFCLECGQKLGVDSNE